MIQVDVNHYTALVTQAAQAQAAAQAMAAVRAPPHTTATLPMSYGSRVRASGRPRTRGSPTFGPGDWQQKNRWPQKKGGGDREKWPKGWNKWERDEKAPGEGQPVTPGAPLILQAERLDSGRSSADAVDLPYAEEATEEDLSRQAQKDAEREDLAYTASVWKDASSGPTCRWIGPCQPGSWFRWASSRISGV